MNMVWYFHGWPAKLLQVELFQKLETIYQKPSNNTIEKPLEGSFIFKQILEDIETKIIDN